STSPPNYAITDGRGAQSFLVLTDCDRAAELAAASVTNQTAANAADIAASAAYTTPTTAEIAAAGEAGRLAFIAAGGTSGEATTWKTTYIASLPVGGLLPAHISSQFGVGGALVLLFFGADHPYFLYPTHTWSNYAGTFNLGYSIVHAGA